MAKGKGTARRKAKHTQGRVSLMPLDAKRIRANLGLLVQKYEGGVKARFNDALGVTRDVTKLWFRTGRFDPYYALLIARQYRVSLDWLLLGVGPERRDSLVSERDLSADLQELAIARIRETNDTEDEAALLSDAKGFFRSERDLAGESVDTLVEAFREDRRRRMIDGIRRGYGEYLRKGNEEIHPGTPQFFEWARDVAGVVHEENRRHQRVKRRR